MEDNDKFIDKYRIDTARLSGWNYGDDGYYFVTICTYNQELYFGDVLVDNDGAASVALTDVGEIAAQCWLDIPKFHPYAVLDAWVIMSNHMHGIIQIDKSKYNRFVETPYLASHNTRGETMANAFKETRGVASLPVDREYQNTFGPQSQNLASIIRGYKSGVTMNAVKHKIYFAWQPRYFDRIIRTERALNAVRRYIINNPKNWQRDRNNPENIWI